MIRIFEEIKFPTPPTMFAAWPGMGNVGIIAMDYLRTNLGAQPFAEIDMSSYFIPDSIIVKQGIAELPDIPGAVFYYLKEPSIIIFESSAQVGGKDGINIIKNILSVATECNVSRIYTAAAFAQPISHNTPSRVMVACNHARILRELEQFDTEKMPDGYIAGLNGLLLGVAATRNIDSACLLGTIPSFASNLSYPKASLEIIRVFEQIIGKTVDKKDIEESIGVVSKQLAAIEDRIKEYFPSIMEKEDEGNDMTEVEDEQVPQYIMEKIENLFQQVKQNKTRASELKMELDRWNLYELYEHRFLSLFKDK